MAKKKRRSKGISGYAEEFAISLIYEATSGKIGKSNKSAITKDAEPEINPVSFRDRAKLLDSITKLLGAQTEPEDDDESGLDEFKARLKDGGTSRSDTDNTEDDDIV